MNVQKFDEGWKVYSLAHQSLPVCNSAMLDRCANPFDKIEDKKHIKKNSK